jgi:hypothetical protein
MTEEITGTSPASFAAGAGLLTGLGLGESHLIKNVFPAIDKVESRKQFKVDRSMPWLRTDMKNMLGKDFKNFWYIKGLRDQPTSSLVITDMKGKRQLALLSAVRRTAPRAFALHEAGHAKNFKLMGPRFLKLYFKARELAPKIGIAGGLLPLVTDKEELAPVGAVLPFLPTLADEATASVRALRHYCCYVGRWMSAKRPRT